MNRTDQHPAHPGHMNHSHIPSANSASNRKRIIIALTIAGTVLVAEILGSIFTSSLTLIVDAAHVFADSFGLIIALIAASLTLKPATSRRTWGWQRSEVIAAGIQAAILLCVGVYALYEGVQRLLSPPSVEAEGMLAVGILGLIGNVMALFVLSGGRKENLNMRAAFLEVASDTLGSLAVIVSAAIIYWTGWTRADAVAGIGIAALIVPRAVLLIRETGAILLEMTPKGLDLDVVRAHILSQPHVIGVHDLHASTVASGLPTLTCHVVLDEECFADGHVLQILQNLQECVAAHHDIPIEHATFQLESAPIAAKHTSQLHA